METITVEMSAREYKKFLAYKEADKIAQCVKNGLSDIKKAREGKCTLKSAYQLAYEL